MDQTPLIPVKLHVPTTLNFQFVYRTERNQSIPIHSRPDLQFQWLNSPSATVPFQAELRRLFGTVGLIKICLKLMASFRRFYVVLRQGRIVHHGWVTFGKCNHYWIEPASVVIGPIWTDSEVRGQRIGTYALQCALNHLLTLGIHLFYIDTAKTNLPCQKLIEHCGFGVPVGLLPRQPEV